ncbi:ABC transporter permease [Nocardiopsis metallicus]|uniref:NitT/TauT family transport system permease protein n=1 Tax=Nocardiopsis metallicus TaxID=179819 RepID=A0A840W8Q9_9ACTN|nr:ABC transporter permease [Nocardiopsis metallicus]MBB5489441.1 NitT/TauT family transport system permease protein [Nocardiopsis metallicus]
MRTDHGARSSPLGTLRRGMVGVATALCLAEAVARWGVDSAALPPVSLVLANTANLLADPDFLAEVGATLTAALTGLGVAALAGTALGLALGSVGWVERASSVVVEFLRPIPSVALIPVAILAFGQGAEMKVALVTYAALWPILFNTLYGVRAVEPLAKESARVFGVPRLSVLNRVVLPSTAPFIAAGVRISAAIALIVTVSAELLAGAAEGLGSWILRMSSGGANTDMVYAGTIVAGLLGLSVNGLLRAVEHRLFRWKRLVEERT